jgi:AhpD family alkylhydroperoxidase
MSRHSPRLAYHHFAETAPQVRAALSALGNAVKEAGLEPALVELVDLRASQMNGCAFCIQHHLNAARRLAMPQVKLDLVAAWREAGVFSAREKAALAWTELLTAIRPDAEVERGYEALCAEFSETEAVALTAAIGAINTWNRLAIAFAFEPPIPAGGKPNG